jgi:hypothetical protein
MSKFVFDKEKLSDVNWDSDLFYDLTEGGYINPSELLVDKALAHRVEEAAALVSAFLTAGAEQAQEEE